MNIAICIGAIWSGVLLLGCASKNLTVTEKKLIRSQESGIMHLYTTDNIKDALFLRQKALPVRGDIVKREEYHLLKAGLLRTVQDTANPGVGIAAPQVGISRQIIVVQRFDKTGEPFEVCLNPEIVFYSEDQIIGLEGCLSITDKSGELSRSENIVVRYVNENTTKIVQDTVKGFTAVIFQHETDHLKGILFTDRMKK